MASTAAAPDVIDLTDDVDPVAPAAAATERTKTAKRVRAGVDGKKKEKDDPALPVDGFCGFDILPMEIVLDLVRLVVRSPKRDLPALRATSQQFRQACSDPSLWAAALERVHPEWRRSLRLRGESADDHDLCTALRRLRACVACGKPSGSSQPHSDLPQRYEPHLKFYLRRQPSSRGETKSKARFLWSPGRDDFFGMCEACHRNAERTVTKTARLARLQFCLTDAQLELVPSTNIPVCHTSGCLGNLIVIGLSAKAICFPTRALEELAIKRWGSVEALEIERQRRADRCEKNAHKKLSKEEERRKSEQLHRRDRLRRALRLRGRTSLPIDSTLCKQYIESGQLDLESVADAVAEWAYMYERVQARKRLLRSTGAGAVSDQELEYLARCMELRALADRRPASSSDSDRSDDDDDGDDASPTPPSLGCVISLLRAKCNSSSDDDDDESCADDRTEMAVDSRKRRAPPSTKHERRDRMHNKRRRTGARRVSLRKDRARGKQVDLDDSSSGSEAKAPAGRSNNEDDSSSSDSE